MIARNAESATEPAGVGGRVVATKSPGGATLLQRRERDDFGISESAVGIDAADDGFDAHIAWSEVGEIDEYTHGHGMAREQRLVRRGTDFNEAHGRPGGLDLLVPRGAVAAAGKVAGAGLLAVGVRGVVSRRE